LRNAKDWRALDKDLWMNANELADELTKMFRGEEYDRLIHEIPDMLRQQHAEIETLRNNGYKTEYELLRMEFIQQQAEIEALRLKQLTHEEISDIRDEFLSPNGCDIYTFAKAILRKSQEETTQSIMGKHCTCYKLGYSQLNNFTKVD
jgi:hypothetical protein